MKSCKDYTVNLEPVEDGFLVSVPELPGCVTWGSTEAEAETMAIDAITAYLESLALEGRTAPENPSLVKVVNVELAV